MDIASLDTAGIIVITILRQKCVGCNSYGR